MRDFAQRGLVASSLGHCGTPSLITCNATMDRSLYYIERPTRVLTSRSLPQEPCTLLARLIIHRCSARCSLRPRGVGFVLVIIALAVWPAPRQKGSAPPKIYFSRSYVSDSEHTPFTSPNSFPFLLRPRGQIQSFHYWAVDYSLPREAYPVWLDSSSIGNHCRVTLSRNARDQRATEAAAVELDVYILTAII